MDKILLYAIVGGFFGTVYGGYNCIEGYTYSVAAQHEATAVGRVVGISHGKGGVAYNYVFSVNGVNVNDYSVVCTTPLAPGACYDKGPVLVYYSYQPFSNSRLQDFTVASGTDYRSGKLALAIALPLFVLSCGGIVFLTRKDKDDDEDDSEPINQSDLDSEVPDALHIAPRE